MYPELKNLLYAAEEHYLQPQEIETCKQHLASLQQRQATYQLLREHELAIFQAIADRLPRKLPQAKPTNLEQGLKRWIAVMRYCAMAMLLNNPEFLQRRLLEWLTDLVQLQQTNECDCHIYQMLIAELPEFLDTEQLALLQPFLTQVENTLLSTGNLAPLPG